jgi:NADPH-dependent ferric siderophore reductase
MSGALVLTVENSESLNGLFQRVRLSGDGLSRIPTLCAGLHIKLFFVNNDQTIDNAANFLNEKAAYRKPEHKPVARTYSIRDFDKKSNLLTVDFVLHTDSGIACDWARNACVGDKVVMMGPGPKMLYQVDATQYLLIGDASALPAITAIIDQIDERAQIYVVIELSVGQCAYIDCQRKERIEWHWLEQHFTPETTLLPVVKSIVKSIVNSVPTYRNTTSVTLAGEHQSVLCLRQYFRQQKLDKKNLYAVPYWCREKDEESYHAHRHKVMDE